MTTIEAILLGTFAVSLLMNAGLIMALIGRSMEVEFRLRRVEKVLALEEDQNG
jgi:hypothetical protein